MNPKISTLLRKFTFLLGAVSLGWAAQAQTTTPADSTHRQGMHRRGDFNRDGNRDGTRGGFDRQAFHRGGGFDHRQGRQHGRDGGIRYTPEQRTQVAAISKDYRQKTEDLYKKDNITLREYKAGLLSLQKEKKSKLEALLTPKQKEDMAARHKRMTENIQVMAVARIERLRLHLNLSDDQVAKIKAGQENLRSQVKAIHENDNLLPQQKMEQMKALMAKRNDTYKSVLTPEQYSQFEKMGGHRRGGFGRHGFGGPGGHGPDGGPDGSRGGFESRS